MRTSGILFMALDRVISNLMCSRGLVILLPCICVLGRWVHTTTPSSYGARNGVAGFLCATPAFYQLHYIKGEQLDSFNKCLCVGVFCL